MHNTSTASAEAVKEPALLEKLAASLTPLKNENPLVSINTNQYDNSVSIDLLLKDKRIRKLIPHEAFRIYDPEKSVSERHVADNRAFIADWMMHPDHYARIRKFLESLGYQQFHNPFMDYIEKRFRECLAQRNS